MSVKLETVEKFQPNSKLRLNSSEATLSPNITAKIAAWLYAFWTPIEKVNVTMIKRTLVFFHVYIFKFRPF